MYISQNSTIYIYNNVECDRTYNNVKWSSSEEDYFYTCYPHRIAVVNRCSYLKKNNSESIKVEVPIAQIFDANYICIENTAFENKRFFCFVTAVNYINNSTTEIEFEIDYWQTYIHDVEFGQCFVEREHVVDDEIGKHTLDEGLEFGELVCESQEKLTHFSESVYFGIETVLSEAQVNSLAFDTDTIYVAPRSRGNVLNGCGYIFSTSDTGILTKVDSIVNAGYTNSIISIFTIPKEFAPFTFNFPVSNIADLLKVNATYNTRVTTTKLGNAFGSYIPKNKKLYCSPYCNYLVYAPNGSSFNCKPELFQTIEGELMFSVKANTGSNVTCFISPVAYKEEDNNYTIGASLNYGIQGSYSYDSYQAMIASYGMNDKLVEATRYGMPVLSSVISGASGVVEGIETGNVVGAISSVGSAISNVTNSVMQYSRDTHDTMALSGVSGNNALWSNQIQDFFIQKQMIREEYAKIIDKYFTMFGYKVNTLKVPKLRKHSSYDYIKCTQVALRGNIPPIAHDTIEAILKKGVTIWAASFGNYDANNVVLY